ncbi:MAG: HAD family hydrolase [Candidatus Krumholzibacteria bacterium]|nr:HAD family hydrolase [Candidatus Krumholzibacteria bacterium]
MIKLIVFDWDDVFTIGSKEGYFACYHNALLAVGVELTPEEEEHRIVAKWGQSHREELKELLKEHPERVDEACEQYEKELFGNTFVDALHVLDGVQELLERLGKKYTLTVVTGQHHDIFWKHVTPKFNIPKVFSKVVSAYQLPKEHQKPDPYPIRQMMEEYDVTAEETIMVGDSISDVQMAKNAGILPVVVLTGYLNREKAEALGVQHIIKDVREIEEVLENLEVN